MKTSRKILAALTGLAALAAAVGALLLCSYAMEARPRILSASQAPEDTAAAFFNAVCAGDYEDAAALVEGCAGLGLDKAPESQAGALVYAALLESFRWEWAGECAVESLEARVPVRFTSLDVPAVIGSLREEVTAVLAARVEAARYADEVYDENGEYQAQVIDAALLSAVETLLADAPERSVELNVTLRYTGDNWLVVWEEALADALCGGAAG